jgi:hypothetical protein
MKRFHVHVAVKDLAASIRFYSAMFDAQPLVIKADYAKWMVEDPRINFAISTRGNKPGVNHLGIQVESEAELAALRAQTERAEIAAIDEPEAACCYARSDKYWTTDPQGIAWETFRTLGSIPIYGQDTVPDPLADVSEGGKACCGPLPKVDAPKGSACCVPSEAAQTKSGACC